MGDKNAPDEFWIVFQGAIDNWQETVTKVNGGIFGCSSYEGRADNVFEKSLLDVGIAVNCERTVGRRMDAVKEALESCGLKQNTEKLVILPNLRRIVENRRFSRSKQEYHIKASHRFLGIVCPHALNGRRD